MQDLRAKQNVEKKWHKVVLFLTIGLVALSSAVKDLNQLRNVTIEATQLIAEWTSALVPTASARNLESCSVAPVAAGSDEFHWKGRVAPGQAIEIRGINGSVVAEPSTSDEVQVVAMKKSRHSDVNSVELKVVQHAGGVTICAIYPNDEGGANSCEPSDSLKRDSSATVNVRNNDVRVDFLVRVPAQVAFIGRTINGEITATALDGNIISKTVNGSIKLSTNGYAEASTVNGEISARLGNANWPTSLAFKTLNGEISLDLPANLSTDVNAETLNGEINSDFPLTQTTLKGRKHLDGRIGSGGRELLLKTLNGSINLRRAG